MPYITNNDFKWTIDQELDMLAMPLSPNFQYPINTWKAGPLNYLLTRLVRLWLGKQPDYERFNAAIGVLESAKLELYRRMVAPYEDKKCEENGDVYV